MALRKQVFTRCHHARLRLVRSQIHHTITDRQYPASTTILSGRGHPPGRAAVGIGAMWRWNDASWGRRERHDYCACTRAMGICVQVAGNKACKMGRRDRVLGPRSEEGLRKRCQGRFVRYEYAGVRHGANEVRYQDCVGCGGVRAAVRRSQWCTCSDEEHCY
jgi:hypothetical protein